jgi:hypothetical protein
MTAQPAQQKKRLPFLVIVLIVFFGVCVFCSIASLAMDKMGLLPTATPTLLPTETPLPTATLPPTATVCKLTRPFV